MAPSFLRSSYTWLLTGLVGTAIVAPFVQPGRAGALVLLTLSVALLAAGVGAVGKRRRHLVVAITLALPAVILSIVDAVSGGDRWAAARHGLQTAFFAYTAAIILGDVVRGEKVTAEKIRGAVCVFLLIGGTWGFAYMTVLRLDPSALHFPADAGGAVAAGGEHPIGDVLYFSFITLTSTGYGDILPVSPLARLLAQFEATVGQLYLAILVARLVGLHIVHADET